MRLHYLDFHMNNFLMDMNNFLGYTTHINTHEHPECRFYQTNEHVPEVFPGIVYGLYLRTRCSFYLSSFLPVNVRFLREWEEFGYFNAGNETYLLVHPPLLHSTLHTWTGGLFLGFDNVYPFFKRQ